MEFRKVILSPTNVDPSMFLQGEDYDLKERINVTALRRAVARRQQSLVGPDWLLLHQQQAEGHQQHACNKSKETIVPFAVGTARGQ